MGESFIVSSLDRCIDAALSSFSGVKQIILIVLDKVLFDISYLLSYFLTKKLHLVVLLNNLTVDSTLLKHLNDYCVPIYSLNLLETALNQDIPNVCVVILSGLDYITDAIRNEVQKVSKRAVLDLIIYDEIIINNIFETVKIIPIHVASEVFDDSYNLISHQIRIPLNNSTISLTRFCSRSADYLLQELSVCITAFQFYLESWDDNTLFPFLIPSPLSRTNTKLVASAYSPSQGTSKTDYVPVDKREIRVWSEPSPSSSLDQLLSLIRVSHCCPRTLTLLLPSIKQKMGYLRTTSIHRTTELVEVLLSCHQNALLLFSSSYVISKGEEAVGTRTSEPDTDASQSQSGQRRRLDPFGFKEELDWLTALSHEVCNVCLSTTFSRQTIHIAQTTLAVLQSTVLSPHNTALNDDRTGESGHNSSAWMAIVIAAKDAVVKMNVWLGRAHMRRVDAVLALDAFSLAVRTIDDIVSLYRYRSQNTDTDSADSHDASSAISPLLGCRKECSQAIAQLQTMIPTESPSVSSEQSSPAPPSSRESLAGCSYGGVDSPDGGKEPSRSTMSPQSEVPSNGVGDGEGPLGVPSSATKALMPSSAPSLLAGTERREQPKDLREASRTMGDGPIGNHSSLGKRSDVPVYKKITKTVPTSKTLTPSAIGWDPEPVHKADSRSGSEYRLLQSDARLSESLVYSLLRRFYEERGMKAWGDVDVDAVDTAEGTGAVGDEDGYGGGHPLPARQAVDGHEIVPQHITSNCAIARAYATIVFSALRDLWNSGKLDVSSPVYVLELGAGHGKFSVLFLRYLSGLLKETKDGFRKTSGSRAESQTDEIHPLAAVTVLLVITDFCDKNFDFLESAPDLQPFLAPMPTHDADTLQWSDESTDVSVDHRTDMAELEGEDSRKTSSGEGGGEELTLVMSPGVWVDFAVVDCEHLEEIQLRRTGLAIGPEEGRQSANPLLVICNYVFDSLVMDCFKVVESDGDGNLDDNCPIGLGKDLQEGLVSVCYSGPKAAEELTSLDLPECSLRWRYRAIDAVIGTTVDTNEASAANPTSHRPRVEYYPEAALNAVLDDALETLSVGSCFTVPVGGIRCLQRLQEYSHSGILLGLVGDKAYNRWDMIDGYSAEGPPIALHGSASLTVNMCAVGTAIKSFVPAWHREQRTWPSFTLHTPQRYAALDICLVASGISSGEAPLTVSLFTASLCAVGVSDLMSLREVVDLTLSRLPPSPDLRHHSITAPETDMLYSNETALWALRVLARILHLSGWDPDILIQHKDFFLNATKSYLESKPGDVPIVPNYEIYTGLSDIGDVISHIFSHLDDMREGVVTYFDQNKEKTTFLDSLSRDFYRLDNVNKQL